LRSDVCLKEMGIATQIDFGFSPGTHPNFQSKKRKGRVAVVQSVWRPRRQIRPLVVTRGVSSGPTRGDAIRGGSKNFFEGHKGGEEVATILFVDVTSVEIGARVRPHRASETFGTPGGRQIPVDVHFEMSAKCEDSSGPSDAGS